jgi:LuxR family maltose regulon positive regulatory protein
MPTPPLILATKLYPPELWAGHVPRPRLVARLREGCPLTLISAPPGFGKSALIAEWQASQDPPSPLAWVALDPDDNDVVRFLTYVCTALARATPGLGMGALALLQGATPLAGLVLTMLINELSDLATRCTLVLEDYHVITARPVHEALVFLLDHLPGGVRLILTSRADPPLPLARWRVRGRLTEIRAQDLRFTTEEASEFLTRLAGHRLTADAMAALERRTEGWIAGLQLAALSLKDEADPEAFVAAFGGSHRYVLDYLMEEVFQRQPPAVQAFLLSTAVLDRMCAPLCDAVMQADLAEHRGAGAGKRKDESDDPGILLHAERSASILEQLERANLFVVALDGERQWYRYHQLFAEALRNRLRHGQGAAVADLHGRASAWYAANGWIAEAIHHAVQAGDYEAAARLIGSHGMGVFMRGQVARLARWLDQVPAAVQRGHPPLNLLRALTAMAGGHYAAVEPCLLEIEAALRESPAWDSPDLRSQVIALRAAALSFLLDPSALDLVRQALQQLPEAHPLRPVLHMGLGNAHYARGDLVAARATLQQTLASLPEDDRVVSWRVGLRVTLVFVLMAQGCLRQADRVAHETAVLTEAVPLLPGSALLQAQLGALAYERGDLEAAERRLARSLELARSIEGYTAEVYARSWLASVRQAQGEPSQALEQMDRAEALARQHQPTPATLNSLAGRRAYLWLAQGDLAAAASWATSQAAAGPGLPLSPFDTHRLAFARVLIAQEEYVAARQAAAALLQAAEATGQGLMVLRALILLALAQAGYSQRAEAAGCLERALILAEEQGYVRTFLDEGPALQRLLGDYRSHSGPAHLRAYAEHLLGAFAAGTSPPPAPPARPATAELVEPLSPRELEVLRLVADGYNNHEVATKLVVGVTTVKKHINAIFGKLGATHRAQAIARARGLGLL